MASKGQLAFPVAYRERSGYLIRLVPALNLAALKARPREDKQLLLWYCLRAIDSTGRGVLEQEGAIAILQESFGYQRQTAYKHLEGGDGVYWRRHITRRGKAIVILFGLLRITQHLQTDIRKRERFLEMPASELPPSSQVQARRALLYNTGAYKPVSVPFNPPISRESLEEKTSIEPRQQRRYDEAMEARGPVRRATFGYYRDQRTAKLRKLVRLTETDRGLVLTHQLANRYWALCLGGSRGMLSKVARAPTVRDQSFAGGGANSTTDRRRRYYRDTKSFVRAALQGKATQGFWPSRFSNQIYIQEVV